MPKESAGILVYRRTGDAFEVLIAHPGGPFWANKHEGAWSIVKGELDVDESPAAAARREFVEETGFADPGGGLDDLGSISQKSGKVVHGFAIEADLDPAALDPGTFVMEWPPRSGRMSEFPEIDRVAWVSVDEARRLLNPAQALLLDRLVSLVASD